MKKTILKFTGLAAMAALMMFNIQFFAEEKGSDISLAFLENLAFADGEDDPIYEACYPGEVALHRFTHVTIVCRDDENYEPCGWMTDCVPTVQECCPMWAFND